MARVQLVIRDEDRNRYYYQARQEGMTLSAWLRAAADERLERNSKIQPFDSIEDIEAFFAKCDSLQTDGAEPDWEQHLSVLDEVLRQGGSST
ncbi:MAG: hypothetical protein OXD44_08345 [Gammaproteobacteria bacterium]|nr:hypothetical protein [Gammaproteobacteria bacterium]